MKAVILAGGLGTRMGHEAATVPKPMVRVGGMPVIWHIMKILYSQGVKEFVICVGHKGEVIRDFFSEYPFHRSDLTLCYSREGTKIQLHPRSELESWTVNVVETGENTATGGRVKMIEHIVGTEDFIITYGDGLADVDIAAVAARHRESKAHLTISASKPRSRFGVVEVDTTGMVVQFEEKPAGKDLVNIGYMVASKELFSYLNPNSVLEQEIRQISQAGKLYCVEHSGFWQPMDTPAELASLNDLWVRGEAPWNSWS